MNSKMREALRLAWVRGHWCPSEISADSKKEDINEIAHRYGDLEFTREEVRGMLEDSRENPAMVPDEIIYRHTESKAEEDARESHRALFGDETPTIKASEADYGTTDRGFELVEFTDRLSQNCQLQQSSAAEYTTPGTTALWLGLSGKDRMHLSESHVALLCECMQRWLDTGSLVDGGNNEDNTLDREVGELQGGLIALTKRVAAIEKRVLADGHSASCGKREVITDNKCTCGHDDIRESRK